MTTSIIGVGSIGKALAQLLVRGGERLILASRDQADAEALARQLGAGTRAAPVASAIAEADTVIFAVSFDTIKQLIAEHAKSLPRKVVVDPSNPIKPAAGGTFTKTLPVDTSAGMVISKLLPAGAHYVKAFGTLGAKALASSSNRIPNKAVLFYATDDEYAAREIERLISAAGFESAKAGGVDAALRIEAFGDLHQFGGLNGKVPDRTAAAAALAQEKGA